MNFERIVHITDTHIVAEYEKSILYWDPIAALEATVESIQSLAVTPQMIVATGDLVHDSSEANYVALKDILTRLDLPVLVTPGNHDSLDGMEKFLVGGNIKLVGEAVVEGVNWGIVFVDSQVEGEEHGKISDGSIVALEQSYREMGTRDCLLALHHSPFPKCQYPDCQLQGKDKLFDFVSSHQNTKAVISGHTHFSAENKFATAQFLTTTSTLFQASHSQGSYDSEKVNFMDVHKFDGDKKGYRILDLYDDGSLRSEACWV